MNLKSLSKDPKNVKEAYETLLLLYIELCRESRPVRISKILQCIKKARENAYKYHFFQQFGTSRSNKIIRDGQLLNEEDRICVAEVLFDNLYGLIFGFEASNIVSMRHYVLILELGRTYIPYKNAMLWGKAFVEVDAWRHTMIELGLNPDLSKMNETAFRDYALQLQTRVPSVMDVLPKEQEVSSFLRLQLEDGLQNSLSLYHDYVKKHYPRLAHIFPYYNKDIRLYLHACEGGLYTARIEVYKSDAQKSTVYRYFTVHLFRYNNYESIEQRAVTSWFVDQPSTIDAIERFKNIFSPPAIHVDLHKIFLRYATSEAVVSYILFLLRAQLKVVNYNKGTEVFEINGDSYLYMNKKPDASVLLRCIKDYRRLYKGIIFRFKPRRDVLSVLEKAQMEMISVEEIGQYYRNIQNSELLHLYISEHISSIVDIPQGGDLYQEAEFLKQQLDECPKGIEAWHRYEQIGTKIFKFLFCDDFRKYECSNQVPFRENLRIDMLVSNIPKQGADFWKLMRDKFNAINIVVDFKNYKDPLPHDEIFKLGKYLTPKNGRFIIVITRCGLDDTAQKCIPEILANDQKLYICLTDDDLKEMIDAKAQYQEPTDLLMSCYCNICRQ